MKLHVVSGFGFAVAAMVGAVACGSESGTPATDEATPVGEAMSTTAQAERGVGAQRVAADHFELSGGGLRVTYAPSAETGLPVFVYQDAGQRQTFSGSDVFTTATEAGTMVSVYVQHTIDSGSTSFSVLIPRVELAVSTSVPVETQGITTVHRLPILPSASWGQLDLYGFTPLQGIATHPARAVVADGP